MAKILLIEDDAGTAVEICLELTRHGHQLVHARSGPEGSELARTAQPHLMIVDRMLPEDTGLELVEQLRATGHGTPTLILSALSALNDRVDGLRAGGDDYLGKPFALVELVARVEALLRRPANLRETFVHVGPLTLDLLLKQAWRADRELNLLPKEFEVLAYLARRPGYVVTRSMLLSDVWGYRFEPRSNVVDVLMGKLRRKVDLADETPLIRNVRGNGYRLDPVT